MQLNRRNFFKSAAAGAAFLPSFSILGSDDIDKDKRPIGPADDQLNVAMIGFGREGEVLAQSIARIPGIRVRAVCDIWKERQKYAKSYFEPYGMKDVAAYEDYREMLDKEDKNIDAVVIATPDWMHCEHTCACLRAGKHVYCEKEMSNKLEQAAEMVRCQRETGKLLQIGHQRRSNPRYRHVLEKVIPQMLGRVTHAYAQWNRTLAAFEKQKHPPKQDVLTKYGYANAEQYANWRWFHKYGGGSMVDLGSHQIDLFFWAWGVPPKSVTAIGGKDVFDPPRETYDNVMCLYEFEMPDGKVNRAYYQVISSNGRGGFYEQFMGENATATIAEISACGNEVQRELRTGGLVGQQWQRFIDEGLILPIRSAVLPDKEETKDITVDSRASRQARGNPIAVELNKPAHMPHLENFFAAVRHGEKLNCPADLAYESAVAVLAANRAVEERKTIYFKPEDFKVS